VLLLDEPSLGLAPIAWRMVIETCRRLADEGRVVVVVEPRVLEALGSADRCVVLQQGRIVRDEAAADGAVEMAELTSSYFAAGERA
jgi:branched-chain amino acid transport system ATP-binding protein